MKYLYKEDLCRAQFIDEPSVLFRLSNLEVEIIRHQLFLNMINAETEWSSVKNDENDEYVEIKRQDFRKAVLAWIIIMDQPIYELLEKDRIANHSEILEMLNEIANAPEYEFD